MFQSLITYKFGEDFTVSGDEMIYHCPFCPEFGKRNNDRKLYVNKKTGQYYCFRCETAGSISRGFGFSKDIFQSPGDAISEILNFIGSDTDCSENVYFRIPDKLVVDYPNTVPYNYMIRRGFTPQMMREYSIRAFGDDVFHNRIVIPNKIVNNNWTDFYTCRSIIDDVIPRYYNSKFANKSNIVFNIDKIKFGDTIIINEGCINSIIAGSNSVAIFGKYASTNQISQIVSKEPSIIYISLDYDAREKALALADILHNKLPVSEIRLVDLPDGVDASDLGRLNYLELVDESKILYNRIFDLKNIFENFLAKS